MTPLHITLHSLSHLDLNLNTDAMLRVANDAKAAPPPSDDESEDEDIVFDASQQQPLAQPLTQPPTQPLIIPENKEVDVPTPASTSRTPNTLPIDASSAQQQQQQPRSAASTPSTEGGGGGVTFGRNLVFNLSGSADVHTPRSEVSASWDSYLDDQSYIFM